jgi:hypothetical protein
MKQIIPISLILLFLILLFIFSCDVQTRAQENKKLKNCDNYYNLVILFCLSDCESNPNKYTSSSKCNSCSREELISDCKANNCYISITEGSSGCYDKAKKAIVFEP